MTSTRKRSVQRLAAEALSSQDEARVTEAVAALEDALALDPGDAKVADQLGDLQTRAGDPFAAVGYYRKAAEAYERDDQVDKAVAIWRKVIRTRPELLDVHVWLADLLVRSGRTADAKGVYERMLSGVEKSNLLAMPNIVAIIKQRMARLK